MPIRVANPCSVATTTTTAAAAAAATTALTSGLNELSLSQSHGQGQHKKPSLVGVQHAKKELNSAGKDVSKHKSVATSTSTNTASSSSSATSNSVSTENIAAATASKLSYAQVAQHHKTSAESKDGTLSPTGSHSHKLELVFGDTSSASSSTVDKVALTATTDKRLGAGATVAGGKAASGTQTTMNANQSSGHQATSAKDKGV